MDNDVDAVSSKRAGRSDVEGRPPGAKRPRLEMTPFEHNLTGQVKELTSQLAQSEVELRKLRESEQQLKARLMMANIGKKQLQDAAAPSPAASFSKYFMEHKTYHRSLPLSPALKSIAATSLENKAVVELRQHLRSIDEAALENEVQASLASALKHAAEKVPDGAKTHILDRSKVRTVGMRKPDFVCTAADREEGADGQVLLGDILAVGELKNGNASAFAPDHVGQLLSVMHDVAQRQPDRRLGKGFAFVIGFACNAANIQFYEAIFKREANGVLSWSSWHALPVVSLKERGASMLVHLMTMSAADLGYGLPSLLLPLGGAARKKVGLTGYLGQGATAVGYLLPAPGIGSEPDSDSVVKAFTLGRDVRDDAAARELRALRGVAQAAARLMLPHRSLSFVHLCIDELLRDSTGRPALLLGPHGTTAFALPYLHLSTNTVVQPSARRPSAAQFCDLVDALLQLHVCGFAHRDPRPENFFLTEEGRFVLGDAGMVAPLGTCYDWMCGVSTRYGPMAALKHLDALESGKVEETAEGPVHGAAEDFEQVARLVFAAVHRMPVPSGGRGTINTAGVVLKVWESVEDCSLLQQLLEAAKAAGEAVQACPVVHEQAEAARAFCSAASSASSAVDTVALTEDAVRAVPEARTGVAAAAPASSPDVSGLLSDEARWRVSDFKALIRREYPDVDSLVEEAVFSAALW